LSEFLIEFYCTIQLSYTEGEIYIMNKLSEQELSQISGGIWPLVVAGYLGYQAFEHSDQIVAGWNHAGKKHL